MQDFPERTELGNGLSWSAIYTSWDWAHHGRFYFVISIHNAQDQVVSRLKVFVDDHAYGDMNCALTKDEIRELVRAELHQLAVAGRSNTEYV